MAKSSEWSAAAIRRSRKRSRCRILRNRFWFFTRAKNFPAQQSYLQRVLSDAKITPRYRTVIEEVLGDDQLSGVRVRNLAINEVSQVDLAGFFVYVGMKPNTAILQNS